LAEAAIEIPDSWVQQISGAAHNHTGPEWAAFLSLCQPPSNPGSLADTLVWGQAWAIASKMISAESKQSRRNNVGDRVDNLETSSVLFIPRF